MDLYAENILDHYRHPRKYISFLPLPEGEGRVRGATVHKEVNASCGDEIELELRIKNDSITDIRWTGSGCAVSQAGMSMLAEDLAGTSISDAAAMTPKTITDLLGVPISARRTKCALLGLHALKNALRAARGEPPQDWNETIGPR